VTSWRLLCGDFSRLINWSVNGSGTKNSRDSTSLVIRQFTRLQGRAIRWLTADNVAARAFMMIAFGVPAGMALWTLAASSILNKTQR